MPARSGRAWTVLLVAAATAGCTSVASPGDATSSRSAVATRLSKSSAPHAHRPATRPSPPLAGRVIVVDPGHNGANGSHPRRIRAPVNAGGFRKPCNTTGTETAAGYPEHAFTFDVAKRLAMRLRARRATVIMTRRNDHGVGPCVNQRGLMAERHHADLLISVHGDGAPADAHGFTVLTPSRIPHYTVSTYARSRRLAVDVAAALAGHGFDRSTYLGRRGIERRPDLGTLNRARVPAVMVEAGNMRNADDARMLSRPRGRSRIARALAAGITDFLDR